MLTKSSQADSARISLYFIILAFFSLFDSISGASCSFSWNNTFYVLGTNSPTSSFTNFSVLAAPVNATNPSWSSQANFSAVPLATSFQCTRTPSGLLILAPLSTSSFVAYDLASGTYIANLQTNNAPSVDLFSLSSTPSFSRIVVPVQDSIYVFGTPDDNVNLWILNLTTKSWTQDNYADSGPDAPTVNNSGLAVVSGKVVVVGGDDGNGPTDKVWSYDLTKKVWQTESEVLPSPRKNPVVVPFGASKIFVFGGVDGSGSPNEDIVSLDFSVSQSSFTLLDNTSPMRPSPASNPSTATLADSLVVYGGINGDSKSSSLNIFNLTTTKWTNVLTIPNSPSNPPSNPQSPSQSSSQSSNQSSNQTSGQSTDWSPDTPLVIGLGGGLGFFVVMAILMLLWEGFRRRRSRRGVQDVNHYKKTEPIKLRSMQPQSRPQSLAFSRISTDSHAFSHLSTDSRHMSTDAQSRYSRDIPEAHLPSRSRVSWPSTDVVQNRRKSSDLNNEIPPVRKRHSGSSYKRFSTASFLLSRIRDKHDKEGDEEKGEDELDESEMSMGDDNY